jgi:hypothetical protein
VGMADPQGQPRRVEGLVGLLARVADSPESGLDLVMLAGEAIAEVARFNMWVLERKGEVADDELWAMASVEEEALDECRAARDRYLASAGDPSAREDLESAIRTWTERLRAAMTGELDP